jgi:hypothetical protein
MNSLSVIWRWGVNGKASWWAVDFQTANLLVFGSKRSSIESTYRTMLHIFLNLPQPGPNTCHETLLLGLQRLVTSVRIPWWKPLD